MTKKSFNPNKMNLVVVGGGTAGYLSALIFKRRFPSMNVTVVKSGAIGILGPGEGLTPGINRILTELGIDDRELIKHTEATIKHGVKFINWNKDSRPWMHLFHEITKDNAGIFKDKSEVYNLYKTSIETKNNFDDINYFTHLCNEDKIDVSSKKDYAYHIDSRKVVDFLEKIALERKIQIIDDIVEDFSDDENGNIYKIILQNNEDILCDFVIDCSGFKRLIIGKHYNTKWHDMSDYFPATRAITGILPQDGIFHPYTEATAMDYGWSWKVPLQHRYGCGYVYDGHYITDEEAENELRVLLGNDLTIVGKFQYNPGYYDKVWVNNCLSVGLSYSFFEPIEATALATVIDTLLNFIRVPFIHYLTDTNTKQKDIFNDYLTRFSKNIIAFIHFHYITNKTNTDFWSNLRNNTVSPDWPEHNIDQFLKNAELNLIDESNYNMPGWYESSWMSIYASRGFYNKDISVDKDLIDMYNKSVVKAKEVASMIGTDHKEFLQQIKKEK